MIVDGFVHECAAVTPIPRKIGQFEISTDGDVVNLWVSPEFNLEVALDYAAAMETTIDRMLIWQQQWFK